MIKTDYDSNFPYMTQNQAGTNMSIVPQQTSSRPSTLLINGPFTNNPSMFTPNDYAKFSLSTPDLINVLTTQTTNEGQPSPGAKILEEIFATRMDNTNNHAVLPPNQGFDPRQYQSTSRNRSISSSMNDNESSTSTAPSSPTSVHRGRDELQHVPSMDGSISGDPRDVVRKEKKRERNRQAAQKCRTRKLTRIAELQKRVNELQGKNKNLTSIAENLQNDIVRLERQLQDHQSQGCTLMNGSGL